MKKLLLILVIMMFNIDTYAAGCHATFDHDTDTLTIPRILIDGLPIFSDVKLRMKRYHFKVVSWNIYWAERDNNELCPVEIPQQPIGYWPYETAK